MANSVIERVLIIGDDIGIFLAVARSLGRRGIEVHVAPTDLSSPGLASRYVAAVHVLPPYYAAPAAWLDKIRELIADYDFRLILPCGDSSLSILDHHAESLGREILSLPNRRAVAAFTDKAKTRALAAKLNVPVAAGQLIARETTAAGLSGQLGLPLVLKPRASYILGSYEMKIPARVVRDLGSLEESLSSGVTGGWLAEAFFHGEGVGVSVLARDGRILLAWQHRRLKAMFETGASTVRTAEPLDRRLLAHVESLANATALDGVAMFEFRRDPVSGSYVLLEVNPRFWGSLALALAAGADFPSLLWDILTGSEFEIGPVRRTGMTKRNMTGEVERLANEIVQAGSASGRILSSFAMIGFCSTLIFGGRFDSWAADDPAPFLMERRQVTQRVVRGVLNRLTRAPCATLPDQSLS